MKNNRVTIINEKKTQNWFDWKKKQNNYLSGTILYICLVKVAWNVEKYVE